MQEGHKPQLLLEAAMAAEGCFEGVEAGDASELDLLAPHRRAGAGQGADGDVRGRRTSATGSATRWSGSRELADRFLFGDAAFTARPHPGRAPPGGDYDHLSRLAEWSGAEDAEAGS